MAMGVGESMPLSPFVDIVFNLYYIMIKHSHRSGQRNYRPRISSKSSDSLRIKSFQ